jgi:hypothetical protein
LRHPNAPGQGFHFCVFAPDIRLPLNAVPRHAGGTAKKREPIDELIDAHV